MLTYDFQQNLETPTLQQNVFYARQLWTYNFGVHNCVANKGIMHTWPETVAKRESAEVTSCLDMYLKENGSGARFTYTV